MQIAKQLEEATSEETPPKRLRLPLTPAKVVADIKKATGLKAGKHQPRLRNIHAGFSVKKMTPFIVFIGWQPTGGTSEQIAAEWELVLQALIDSGYMLIANVLHAETRVFGGPEALRIARMTQVVAVQRLG